MSSWAVACSIGTTMSKKAGAIKLVEEQKCWLHRNPVRIVSDGDRKFENGAVQDFASSAGIKRKITPSYNLRGNAKVDLIVGMLKRAVTKVIAKNMDQDWDISLGKILGGYRRRPGTDGKSLFEILFRIKHRLSYESPNYQPIAVNGELIRGLQAALVKSLKVPRIVLYTSTVWPNKFEVGTRYSLGEAGESPFQRYYRQHGTNPSLSKPRIIQDTCCVQMTKENSYALLTHAD